jgi:hypothetical protein
MKCKCGRELESAENYEGYSSIKKCACGILMVIEE